MSKAEQILNLQPGNELRFRGPFESVITAELTLSNPSTRNVCFKVKTTAPKRYCVRPNSGLLEQGAKVAVSVMLQPFEFDPNEKNKHKFMVQTMFAPDGATENNESMWKEAKPEDLMDSKLKCVFEMPTEISPQNNLEVSQDDSTATAKMNIKSPIEKVTPKSSNPEERRHGSDDMKRLSTEIQKLSNENKELKDEGVRLRKLTLIDTTASTPSMSHTAVVEAPANALPPIVYLIAAVILGLIIGKFIL